MNPLHEARKQAQFWRFLYCLTVPPLFVALVVMTSAAHTRQAEIRQEVSQSLALPIPHRASR